MDHLITDCFPAVALGMEKAERDIMRRAPRDAKAGVFAGGMAVDIAYQGLIVTGLTLLAYFLGHYIEQGTWAITNSADGTTMAFLTMSMAEICHSFNMRSQRGSLFKLKTWNPALAWAGLASFIATTLVIEVPFLSNAFGFTAISLHEYLIAIGLAICVIRLWRSSSSSSAALASTRLNRALEQSQRVRPRRALCVWGGVVGWRGKPAIQGG